MRAMNEAESAAATAVSSTAVSSTNQSMSNLPTEDGEIDCSTVVVEVAVGDQVEVVVAAVDEEEGSVKSTNQ